MKIEVRGIARDPRFRAGVAQELTAMTGRLRLKPITAQVSFTDENGPKGGVAIRCLVEVRLPRRPPIDARHVAESPPLALEGALAKLERQLVEDRDRLRDRRRRPKKYYAAERARIGGTEELPRTA
jgi:ribosome-associated translation inhibitor RaiA